VRRLSELSKRVWGFKPTIVEIDPDTGRPVLIWKSEHKLHLPGVWSLSLLKKRGIPLHISFREVQRGPAPIASPRPVLSPATIVSARIARMAIALSRESSWDFRPRSTFQMSGSSLPLTVPPLVRPVVAWDSLVKCKWDKGWRGSDLLPLTLGVLPEFPAFNLRSEKVVGPDYCSPLSGPICVTSWARRSQLALPEGRVSRIQGLPPRDHLSEPGVTVAGLSVTGLNIMDSCRPVPSRSSRAGMGLAGPLSAILNPGPTSLLSPITPSLNGPNLQRGDPDSPSLLDVSPTPHLFATRRQFCDEAIPPAETGADGRGSLLWFAVRVPSPHILETPTPLDISKRLPYLHAARSIRFSAIPAEIIPHLAGLPAASGQALRAAPDLSSHSATFQKFERPLPGVSVPEVSEVLPPEAPAIQRALEPADQVAVVAEPFLPHNLDRFPMGPAILWTSTLNEAALREARPAADVIRPVPDGIAESLIPQAFVERFPAGPAVLSITTLNQAALRESGPTTVVMRPVLDGITESLIPQEFVERFPTGPAVPTLNQAALRESGPTTVVMRPVPDGIAEESFLSHKVNRFGRALAIQWTATVNEAVLRGAPAAIRGVHPVPDCPQVFVFQNRSRLETSWGFPFASPAGASFAAHPAQPYEPMGELGGPSAADRAVMPENVPKPWNNPAHRASGMEEMLSPVRVAPARASFRQIAHPESMHSSFDTDLRDRIFNPILPQLPRTHLRPATVEVIGSRLRESRVFAPVGYRWQRHRSLRDRGAPWKIPTRIGLRPPPAPPHWPGPLSAAESVMESNVPWNQNAPY